MKSPTIAVTDNRSAYKFRKHIMDNGTHDQKQRVKKVGNKSLMYALTFANRTN